MAEQPDSGSAEQALAAARSCLQRGRIAEAASHARRVLEVVPGHGHPDQDQDGTEAEVEALYLLAVSERYLKHFESAAAMLDRLLSTRPEYGRAHQERGHLARATGDAGGAVRAYTEAVRCNPALPASWKALAELHELLGNGDAARAAAAQHGYLSGLPRELVSVSSFLHEGRLYKAERLCRAFLDEHPHHLEAMRLLAVIGMELHVLDDAEFLLESALTFDPGFMRARVDYVRVLQRRQKFDRALAEARRLVDGAPDNRAFRSLHADACMAAGDYAAALASYDALLRGNADDPQLQLARGHALKTIGRHDEAVAAYRAASRLRPTFGDAYWSRANLKTYRFDDSELSRMRAAEGASSIGRADRYHLCFALGKALADRGEFAEAFHYYQRGNALKRSELRYRPERLEAEFARQRAVCGKDLLQRLQGAGCAAADPIFIVGLPRAGSTLIEQILASHSQVDGTFELPNVLALVHRLRGRGGADEPRYPGVLEQLRPEMLRQFGQRYLEGTRMHRGDAPFFTDKMPNNFRHLGLIHLMLPNARIIDARRRPMACCWSGFEQLFAEGQEFSYDLEDLGRYYRGYVELMDHWEGLMPERILRVCHEDVVQDLEGQVRRLLAFLELPFEEACLRFHETERSVRTASSEQVRRPINADGVERWRHFEPWLAPLRAALGPGLAG